MPDHTPGRLAYHANSIDCIKIGTDAPDGPILARMEVYASDDPDLPDAVQLANARRLVALWNACIDLSDTAVLEYIAVAPDAAGRLRRLRRAVEIADDRRLEREVDGLVEGVVGQEAGDGDGPD